ncbi:hypothetical protein F0M03_11235, partial [Vibrio parahaemolyticus]|nr:hypothetical protein [Vibrio parahaemolyticus]
SQSPKYAASVVLVSEYGLVLIYHTWHVSKLTNCLRGIRNAWHFYYALV